MYSFSEYIESNFARLPWITNKEKQIHPIAGLDAAASLLENYADKIYPLVLVEDLTDGFFSHEDGFLNNYMKPVWIMSKPENPEVVTQREDIMKKCLTCGQDLIKLLIADTFDNQFAYSFDKTRIGYYPMSNIGYCFGYIFNFSFKQDVDLVL